MAELADEIYEQIAAYCEIGNQLADEESYQSAILQFKRSWGLLPEPKYDWEAATFIRLRRGQCLFELGETEKATEDWLRLICWKVRISLTLKTKNFLAT